MGYIVRGVELLWLNLEIMSWIVIPSSWGCTVVMHAVEIFCFPSCNYQGFFKYTLIHIIHYKCILKCTPET